MSALELSPDTVAGAGAHWTILAIVLIFAVAAIVIALLEWWGKRWPR